MAVAHRTHTNYAIQTRAKCPARELAATRDKLVACLQNLASHCPRIKATRSQNLQCEKLQAKRASIIFHSFQAESTSGRRSGALEQMVRNADEPLLRYTQSSGVNVSD